MPEQITWEDPPPRPTGVKGSRPEFVAALKRDPGRWAVFSPDASRTQTAWMQAAGLETRCVHTPGSPPHRVKIYARWPEDGA